MSDNNNGNNVPRDVRTVLLCKIQNDYKKYYNNIYAPKGTSSKTYMTMGGFNAVSVYPTMDETLCTKTGWAQYIYTDKENTIGAMDENISYHPIHLVSYDERVKSFWDTSSKDYPFFLMTFVYGVDRSKFTKEDSENLPYLNSTTSGHERRLLNYLLTKNLDKKKLVYAVYHAVNLSDLVILWFASDITYALSAVTAIGEEGVARKTYTTVGLPLQNGQIPVYMQELADSDDERFHLRITGTIRDYSRFSSLFSTLVSKQSEDGLSEIMPYAYSFSEYGENDFSILTGAISNSFLINLFKFWLKYAEEWKDACWEIHTDILYPKDYGMSKVYKPSSPISDILTDEYKKFLVVYKNHLKKYKWASTLLELLSVYVNIDRHPVLHGPGYLVCGCVKIANAYFGGQVPGFSIGSNEWTQLLLESQENIERFVRNWSQLTDQVTRIDDVMLHGLGNIVAIHNTLPEFIMDCYHALMHELVDMLVLCDNYAGRMKYGQFEYDFLFVPELSQRMRISKMFNTKDTQISEKLDSQVWPSKQAYLMEFPTQYIYRPMTFFLQLAHECFHVFGDSLRRRRMRANCMTGFLAAHFLEGLGLSDSNNTLLFKEVERRLHITNEEIQGEFYLDIVLQILSKKFIALADRACLAEIYESAQNYFSLYDDSSIERWIGLESNYYSESWNVMSLKKVLVACGYYFRECYADAMMVAFLKLTPDEYISLFEDEMLIDPVDDMSIVDFDSFDSEGNYIKNIQRISIVLSACCITGYLDQDICVKAIENSFENKNSIICTIQKQTFFALVGTDFSMPVGKWCSQAGSLFYVVEYLKLALNKLSIELKKDYLANPLTDFRKNFDSIARKEKLFGKEFYEVISCNHNKVRNN